MYINIKHLGVHYIRLSPYIHNHISFQLSLFSYLTLKSLCHTSTGHAFFSRAQFSVLYGRKYFQAEHFNF